MKLSVALVTLFVLSLGVVAGIAHAQEAPDPAAGVAYSGAHVARTGACPVTGNVAAGQAPYEEQCQGYPQSVAASPDAVVPLACDVSAALIEGIDANGGTVAAEALAGVRLKGCPTLDSESPHPPPGCRTDCDPKGGGPPQSEVLARNQTADGGLPRTGPSEVTGALAFGLTSLGGFIRRFLP